LFARLLKQKGVIFMSARSKILLKNGCYHLTARGNQKQRIFLDDQDYAAFVGRLKKYKRRYGLKLYGFCLMPNHLHLIAEFDEPQWLSKFMQVILRSYTSYFNKKYNKVGHLWQGRFNSRLITRDAYLLDCLNYVEFNPVRAGIARSAGDYKWSSYKERALEKTADFLLIDSLEL